MAKARRHPDFLPAASAARRESSPSRQMEQIRLEDDWQKGRANVARIGPGGDVDGSRAWQRSVGFVASPAQSPARGDRAYAQIGSHFAMIALPPANGA